MNNKRKKKLVVLSVLSALLALLVIPVIVTQLDRYLPFRQALRNCFRGRPGVVHLDVPESVMNGKQKFS